MPGCIRARLKIALEGTDAGPMFRRLSEPLPLSEASLLVLRPALNAPVLNVGFLPVGPARAAIVVFGEEWGGMGIALGVRSNESGQIAVFRNQEQIEPEVEVGTALEPLLAEAERLGFVFDEDMLASAEDGRARARAMSLWGRLMGEIDMPPAPRAAPAEPAATESVLPPARHLMDPVQERAAARVAAAERASAPLEELVLEKESPAPFVPEVTLDTPVEHDSAEIPLDEVIAPSAPDVSQATQPMVAPVPQPAARSRAGRKTAKVAEAAPAASPASAAEAPSAPESPSASRRKLSKFRAADAAVAAEEVETAPAGDVTDSGTRANALGRIPIVRVRKGRDGSRRVPYLARLLASF